MSKAAVAVIWVSGREMSVVCMGRAINSWVVEVAWSLLFKAGGWHGGQFTKMVGPGKAQVGGREGKEGGS